MSGRDGEIVRGRVGESGEPRRIALVTTGGTIEKTYEEGSGELVNRRSIVRRMLGELRLEETEVNVIELMSKDSLVLTDADRERISEVVQAVAGKGGAESPSGVVILHGTDTLEKTGERLLADLADLGGPPVPVILTGAIRPFEMKRSDALQNLTEALFAAGVLSPGVYCVAHGRALAFPGVVKDREKGTFLRRG